jgi:hypothetical protein
MQLPQRDTARDSGIVITGEQDGAGFGVAGGGGVGDEFG